MRSAEDRLSEQLQRVTEITPDFTVPSQASLEDRVRQIALREGVSLTPSVSSVSTAITQQTPSPQPTSRHPHAHNDRSTHMDDNDIQQFMKSYEKAKLQLPGSSKITEKDGIRIMGKDNESKAKHDLKENKRADSLGVQEMGIDAITVEREIPAGLESASSTYKAHISDVCPTLSPKLKQKVKQTFQSTVRDASSYSHLQDGPPAHQSDKMASQDTFTNAPLSVFISSKEQNHTVSSETNLNKDKDVDQNTGTVGGYSQKSSRHQQVFPNAQRLTGSSRSLSFQAAGKCFLFYFVFYVNY